ncbi:MAG: methylenetetrahydrofolate reductase [NAD(P)H] [Opitutales bacterium]
MANTIASRLSAKPPVLSVEFFPPKDEAGEASLYRTAAQIKEEARPDFVSVTYGAGGTTRERTLQHARRLKDEYGFEVMPHLTCVGHSRDELREIISGFRDDGFRAIMALRGDPPKGEKTFKPHPDGLAYGSDLVAFIKDEYPEFEVGAGGYPEKHPEADTLDSDLSNLLKKTRAGADFITTQLFFDNRDFLTWRDKAQALGVNIPIVPGLMPVLSLKQVERFCGFCGATIPQALRERLEAVQGDAKAEARVGQEWATEQANELLESGVPGIHFYILNRSESTLAVIRELSRAGFSLPQAS